MVNIVKIQTALLGLVGFKQPYNPEYAIVDTDNQASLSGYYFTDNAYAKIEYIKDSQDYLDISDADFNTYLLDIQKSAISNVCNQVYNEYDFIDRGVIYKNALNKVNTETLPNGFVGYKITPPKNQNEAFAINRVLLDFSGSGTFDLLLWNTAEQSPIQTKTITISGDHQVVELNWVIDNSSDTHKGEWYIGYNTTGLTVTPFKRDYANSDVMTKYISIGVEKVLVGGHNTTTLFDLQSVEGLSQCNGLNLDISVYRDFTDFTINNKMLFARAIQLQGIINCIQGYMASLRNNVNNDNAEMLYQKMMIDLEGTATNKAISVIGLKNKLVSEITQIKAEIDKLRMNVSKSNKFQTTTMI